MLELKMLSIAGKFRFSCSLDNNFFAAVHSIHPHLRAPI